MTSSNWVPAGAAVAAAAVYAVGYWRYVREVVGPAATRPSRASWSAWGFADLLLVLSVGYGLWRMPPEERSPGDWVLLIQPAVLLVGAVAVCAVILRPGLGYSGWTLPDGLCVAASVVSGLVLAVCTVVQQGPSAGSGAVSGIALAFALAGIGCAAWPTFAAAFREPRREDFWGWVYFTAGAAIALAGVWRQGGRALWQWLVPAFEVGLNGSIMFLCVRGRRPAPKAA